MFYARAVDNTMLVALNTLASSQTKGTEKTKKAMNQLLDYAATHPNAKIRYHRSKMKLHDHSDASHLSEPKSRSRAGGFMWLGDEPIPDPKAPPPRINGAIHVVCQIIKSVTASAAESETAALFINGQEACPIRVCLEEMGWPQGATPITTDNSCAVGIANDTVKQRRSKAIDMRYYWIRDRVHQGQFTIHWRKGGQNLADYFTKHHPTSHHKQMRSKYLFTAALAAHCEGVLMRALSALSSKHASPACQKADPARQHQLPFQQSFRAGSRPGRAL